METRADADVAGERKGALGVWLSLLALALVAGLGLVAVRSWAAPLDARAELERLFVFEELPFDLVPVAAVRLEAGGERVLKLEALAYEEAPRVVVEEPDAEEADDEGSESEEGDSSGSAPARIDWSKLALGPPGSGPVVVFLVERAKGTKPAALDAAVRRIEWKDLSDVEAEGGRVPLEKGELDWHGWFVEWVIERELESGGTFRDWARADLSVDGDAVLLVARWARGLPASKASLEQLVGAFAPHAPEEPAADEPAAPQDGAEDAR